MGGRFLVGFLAACRVNVDRKYKANENDVLTSSKPINNSQ